MSNKDLYKQAGVDIQAGRDFVESIKPLAKMTMRRGAGALGGFAGLFDLGQAGYQDPVLVATTDGVGTKLLLAQQAERWEIIGQDLVAVCVNDVIAQGAEPLFFLDYIACGALEGQRLVEIVSGIKQACCAAHCALIGGETAEMPALYKKSAFDIAGFAVGAVERTNLLPKGNAMAGDLVLGLASNGVHANGFSLVQKILSDQKLALDKKLADDLLRPTRLYVAPILEALGQGFEIKSIAHITGGGLIENLPRALAEDSLALEIDSHAWPRPEIFSYLQRQGNISDQEMLNVFNCGIGLALIISKSKAEALSSFLQNKGEKVFIIGRIIKKTDQKINITL